MATNRWTAKAQKTAQVNSATPANVNIGNTFTLTINGKSEVFTATAATVANVTAGLPPLWNDSDEGEMNEAEAVDNTTNILITAEEPGVPFTQTSSASGGTATLTTATPTANVSPNDINNATNWTDGIPTASDDCVLDAGDEDASLWWNLGALSAITLTSFVRRFAFTGRIGLDEYNQNGTEYFEYRATELAIAATTMRIEQPNSDGVAHVKVNVGSVQTALHVLGESSARDLIGNERMWWRGTHASNVVNVTKGSLAIGTTNLNSAVVATLRAEESTVRCGSACTLTTVTGINSTLEINSAVTTLNADGEQSAVIVKGSGTITTFNHKAGRCDYNGNGTITTYTPSARSILDMSQGVGPVTITNAVTIPADCEIYDPEGRLVFSGGFALGAGVTLADVRLNLGSGRSYTVS